MRHMADLWRHARAVEWRRVPRKIFAAWGEYDILTFASAISFQVLFALIPLVLFVLGLLGSFDLDSVWERDLAPDVRSTVSPDVFRVIDETAHQVLTERQLFWASAGAVIAVWEVSGAMRGVMDVLDRMYGSAGRRPFWSRLRVSIGLSLAVTVLLLAATAVVRFGPQAVDGLIVARVASWAVALGLMLVAVALVIRIGPAVERPFRWVSTGALLVVGGWTLMSLVFGWYLTSVADYGSIFGNLATIVVLFEYLYLSAIALLTGLLVDAKANARMAR
jgi:membrane protein